MKTFILSLVIVIALPALAGAQKNKREVPRVNIELGGGVSFWQNKDGGTGVESGPTLFVEGRYNVLPLPVNVGLHVDISTFRRIREDNDYEKPRSLKFVIAGDYNLRRGKLVNPFAGIGVGIALDEQDFDRTLPSRTGACLVPRAGVRLLGHIVLALDYEISRVSHNHFDFKMGFCF